MVSFENELVLMCDLLDPQEQRSLFMLSTTGMLVQDPLFSNFTDSHMTRVLLTRAQNSRFTHSEPLIFSAYFLFIPNPNIFWLRIIIILVVYVARGWGLYTQDNPDCSRHPMKYTTRAQDNLGICVKYAWYQLKYSQINS